MPNVARRDNTINVGDDDDIDQLPNTSWPHKRGNFNSKSERRKKTKTLCNNIKEELDTLLNADKGESPLILFELSNHEQEKMKPNSIFLDNAYIIKDKDKSILHQKIHYSNYVMRDNITKNDDKHYTHNNANER